jgi:drug/metabolite transporter (DMT)-like permease
LSATEAVFLKRALLAAEPLITFAVWAIAGFVLFVIAAPVCCGRSGLVREGRIFRTHWLPFLALAATTGLMQLSTLFVLTGFQVAAALALFQTSILLTVFLGWRVFREQNFIQRLLGALVMVVGAVLVVLCRP